MTESQIEDAYLKVLGRAADPDGLAHFKSVTEAYRLTHGRLMHILADSDEFKARSETDQAAARTIIEACSHPSEAAHWFHSITLPDGHVTNGVEILGSEDPEDMIFKYPIEGKTVLDIGAWDGYFSFAAEQRKASDVLATDWYCWDGPGWGTKAGFDFAHQRFNSKVRSASLDVFSLDPKLHGTFDVVLFTGVLYHLPDPLGGLRIAASMCSDHLVVSSATLNASDDRPIMEYAEGVDGDATTYWLPNPACIIAILKQNGFRTFEIIESIGTPTRPRHIVHAWR